VCVDVVRVGGVGGCAADASTRRSVRCLDDDTRVAPCAASVARELRRGDVEWSVGVDDDVDAAVGVAAGGAAHDTGIVEPEAARWLLRGRLAVEWS